MTLRSGESVDVSLHFRNFLRNEQTYRIEVHTPEGVRAEPAVLEGILTSESRAIFPIRLKAASDAAPGVHVVAFDVTVDGRRHGERFDLIVGVASTPAPRSPPIR